MNRNNMMLTIAKNRAMFAMNFNISIILDFKKVVNCYDTADIKRKSKTLSFSSVDFSIYL